MSFEENDELSQLAFSQLTTLMKARRCYQDIFMNKTYDEYTSSLPLRKTVSKVSFFQASESPLSQDSDPKSSPDSRVY